jgi:hypothetical protein
MIRSEGFKDIFWEGDLIAWKNLFSHYLLCANMAFSLWSICAEEIPISWDQIPILDPHGFAPTDEFKEHNKELIEQFFADPLISNYIQKIATQNKSVSIAELSMIDHTLTNISGDSRAENSYFFDALTAVRSQLKLVENVSSEQTTSTKNSTERDIARAIKRIGSNLT